MAKKKKASANAKKITRPKKPVPRKAQKTQKAKAKRPSSKKPSPKKAVSANAKITSSKKMTALVPHIKDSGGSVNEANKVIENPIDLLPEEFMEDMKISLNSYLTDFRSIANNNLKPAWRRRKIGAGIRNYGFIDKASDLAFDNSQYAMFFRVTDLKNCIRNIETCREIVVLLQGLIRAVTDTMLVYSDLAFDMARDFYHTVQGQAGRGDPEALAIFRALQPFFKRPRHSGAEPTEKELERDLHALIHGKKDGEIIVRNVTPKVSGGVRKVVDNVRKSKAMAKESDEAEVED